MVTIGVSVAAFVLLAASIVFIPAVKIGKVKIGTYWLVALLGAATLLITKQVPIEEVGRALVSDEEINPLKILVLFFSMTFLSVYLDEVGLFAFLAQKAAGVARTKQTALFAVTYFLTAFLTVFTSNDVVILTLTPFLCFFCKKTNVDPLPYLVGEFVAANTWSMALLIGNPTNIYLSTAAGIVFLSYSKVMILPTLAAGLAEFLTVWLLFRKKLKREIAPSADTAKIESKPDLIVGVAHLVVCLVFLVVSGYIKVQMWLISAIAAGSLLVCSLLIRCITKKGWRTLGRSCKRLPYQLIPFVLGMFVVVIALEYQGVSGKIGALLGEKTCVFTYGAASFLMCNVINNIPMSILFSSVTKTLSGQAFLQATYASVIGSNLGAFLTPVGALAGIMFTDLTARYHVEYGFKKFIFYGFIVSIPTLAVALTVLFLLV